MGHRCRRIRPGRSARPTFFSARPTVGAYAASRLCRFSSGLERMYVKIRGPDVKMRGTAGGCRGEWSSRKKDAVVDNRARRLQEEVERGVRHADLRARAAHVTRPAPTRERAPTPHRPDEPDTPRPSSRTNRTRLVPPPRQSPCRAARPASCRVPARRAGARGGAGRRRPARRPRGFHARSRGARCGIRHLSAS